MHFMIFLKPFGNSIHLPYVRSISYKMHNAKYVAQKRCLTFLVEFGSSDGIYDLFVMGVHCSDWLLSRRHCSQNWSQMIVSVREKINTAIQDMPAVDDVANLLRGTCLFI